jgi:hypothetical protein
MQQQVQVQLGKQIRVMENRLDKVRQMIKGSVTNDATPTNGSEKIFDSRVKNPRSAPDWKSLLANT